MTTAHRPTWAPAMGHDEQGGLRQRVPTMIQSAKAQPSELTLKSRRAGQATEEDVQRRDLRAELEERERKHAKLDKREEFERERAKDRQLLDASAATGSGRGLVPNARDADDEVDASGASSSDDDDEDDLAALQAELEKLKAERASEAAAKAAKDKKAAEEAAQEEILRSNPQLRQELGLDTAPTSFQVKRRWDDDVVFKNQAKRHAAAPHGKRFINDTVRSDFHQRFLDRYIK